tara:strand:+ start:3241 stop:3516 length:276 start_codon:yes stop_codon:yes gene_type:complete
MAASRVADTVYTNDTGEPMPINISMSIQNGANAIIDIVPTQGAAYVIYGGTNAASGTIYDNCEFVVEPGATYKLRSAVGLAIIGWAEFRLP